MQFGSKEHTVGSNTAAAGATEWGAVAAPKVPYMPNHFTTLLQQLLTLLRVQTIMHSAVARSGNGTYQHSMVQLFSAIIAVIYTSHIQLE